MARAKGCFANHQRTFYEPLSLALFFFSSRRRHTLLPVPREHCLSASDCASEPSRSCLLGFTRHAGDIQPHANLSYPTSPDISEYPVETSCICGDRFEQEGLMVRAAVLFW